VGRPCVERGARFLGPIVLLVHSDDPAATSADVVQNCFGDFETHAEALKSRRDGAAQIVNGPR
jgi:hypothetical protein